MLVEVALYLVQVACQELKSIKTTGYGFQVGVGARVRTVMDVDIEKRTDIGRVVKLNAGFSRRKNFDWLLRSRRALENCCGNKSVGLSLWDLT